MSTEEQVRQASKRFYAGLTRMANGDVDALADSWSHDDDVTTMHPIGGRQMGWEAVKASFEGFAQLATGGRVDLTEQLIRIAGDQACEVGIERGEVTLAGQTVTIDQRVTNVYRHADGEWKMIHHHADVSPAMQRLLEQQQGRSAQA